jgi:dimethylamine---corrinoid protein Co-methyltransferase
VGTGDPHGMGMAHALASSMGGIKTAGDLVARMQLTKMRLNDAKRYVADKLHCSLLDLSDSTVMRTLREELDIGVVTAVPGIAKGLEAKARIADLLGVRINSVERLKGKMGVGSTVASHLPLRHLKETT